jgi:hypothetical protein
MTPMGLNSTPFLTYRDINTDKIDLFEDAFGFNAQYNDITGLLKMVKAVPGKSMTSRVIRNIKKQIH